MTGNVPQDKSTPDHGIPEDVDIEISLEPGSAGGEPSALAAGEEPQAFTAPAYPPIPPAESGPGDDSGVLVIESEDLEDVPEEANPPGGSAPIYPAVDFAPGPALGAPFKGKVGPLSAGLIGSLVLQSALAGAAGGFLAWGLWEPHQRAVELQALPRGGQVEVLTHMALWGASIAGLIGLALGAVEGLVIGAWSRAVQGGLLGLVCGAAGGACGSAFAQVVYNRLGGGDVQTPLLMQIAARTLAWTLVGACVGIGPGVMLMAPRKLVNGLVGGAAGGFVGGLLFDPIGFASQIILGAAAAGTASRFLGIIVMGACTGLGIGLVEEIRKQAWLMVVSGPLAGKQFIIYKHTTWIGSAPGMDIPLLKDRTIAPKQCVLEAVGSAHILRDTAGNTFVNGRPGSAWRLSDGDVIQIGQTDLQYRTRPLGVM